MNTQTQHNGARGNYGQNRTKITFEANIPRVVQLEYDDGTIVEGKFGDQYQYFLRGHAVMWVDPILRDAILASGARAGDSVAITKRTARTGNKRAARWEVELVSDETASGYQAEDEDLPPLLRGGAYTDAPRQAQQAAPRAQAPLARPREFETRMPIGGEGEPAVQRQRTAPRETAIRKPPTVATHAESYAACITQAIDIAIGAQAYAAAKGVALDFNAEDVRAIAATLFIEERGKR